ITFRALNESDFVRIAGIMLSDTKKTLAERGIDMMWTPAVEAFIAKKSYSEKYGARNMRRFISREIEDVAAEKIISDYEKKITLITIECDGERLDIQTK
ncbi:MAG: ATP-dependent Clp protease ATP-binding subunit, partial [Ruminococcus sp.]|nr:ATP-dependent Clp protease ATP-binding subunit [Candidatus Apopatosoma intestinale]